MKRLIWAAALGLVACSEAPSPGDPFEVPLRNPTAQLASQSGVLAEELDGAWVVRQVGSLGQPWPGGRRQIEIDADGEDLRLRIDAPACPEAAAAPCRPSTGGWTHYDRTGEGRWRAGAAEAPLSAGDYPSDLWLLWADTARRTVAIGDPGGSFVLILDRGAAGGADRIAAAREVLDWYGYDLSRVEAP